MKFLGVPVESGINMMFAPASIQPYFFSLYADFPLNILMNIDFPSKSSGSLRIDLLKSLMPVVDV